MYDEERCHLADRCRLDLIIASLLFVSNLVVTSTLYIMTRKVLRNMTSPAIAKDPDLAPGPFV